MKTFRCHKVLHHNSKIWRLSLFYAIGNSMPGKVSIFTLLLVVCIAIPWVFPSRIPWYFLSLPPQICFQSNRGCWGSFSTFSSSHSILIWFYQWTIGSRCWIQLRACSSSPQRNMDGTTSRCLKFQPEERSCSAGTCSWTCNFKRIPLAKICV